MHDVNWWLMALSFLLGLVLTFLLMIRKVTREVPVTHTVSAAVKTAAAGAATATAAKLTAEKVTPKVEKAAPKVAPKAAPKVAAAKIANVLEHEPYGAGSIRVTSRFAAPEGYTIKGDKDTGRYFTVDSPDYGNVEAEVWFANEESAQKAGFLHWAAAAGAKVKDAVADAAKAVIHGGETTPASSAAVITGGGAVSAAAAARIVSIEEVPAGPHGKGSAKAGADGSGPAGWLIKGNADSMLYHGPDSPAYEQTIAEVWFFDEATAKAAGFDKWDKNFK